MTSPNQLPLPAASTENQSPTRISTNNVDRKSIVGAPKVVHQTDDSDRKVTKPEEVIFGLVRRLSTLTSYILNLEVRLADQNDRLAELTRENEVLRKARRRYERAVQELKEERQLNSELRNRMSEAERTRSRRLPPEGRREVEISAEDTTKPS